jgi:hypothetical protein
MSDASQIGVWGVPLAILAGTIRVSTPFMLVSIGECITEKSGRINLGLEGILVMGAMSGYAVAYLSGSPWLGVLAAGLCGMLLAILHGLLCSLQRVNDIAIGISLMLLGTGLAFFFGKSFIQPTAPNLPSIPFGGWSSYPQVQSALEINVLFIAGIVCAVFFYWALRNTRWGLMLRTVGDSESAARALGFPGAAHPHRRHRAGRLAGRHRRLLPVAGLSGQLERVAVQRPGPDGGGAGDFRALASVALRGRRHDLRRRRRDRTGAAIGRRHQRLLPVQCGALCIDAGGDDRQFTQANAGRRAGRTQPDQIGKRK